MWPECFHVFFVSSDNELFHRLMMPVIWSFCASNFLRETTQCFSLSFKLLRFPVNRRQLTDRCMLFFRLPRVTRARYCYGKLSVRPSVRNVDRDHIGWKSSKIISLSVSLVCSLSADPNITGLLQAEHPKILAEIGEGYQKTAFGVQKL